MPEMSRRCLDTIGSDNSYLTIHTNENMDVGQTYSANYYTNTIKIQSVDRNN